MRDYTIEFVDSMPQPLEDVESDQREIQNFYHVAEMSNIKGQNRVEYGGESPWTHVWRGSIPNPESIDALELSNDVTVQERIEHEIDRLMKFIITESATPSRSSPDDFEWSVYVHNSEIDNPMIRGRMVKVVWEPK